MQAVEQFDEEVGLSSLGEEVEVGQGGQGEGRRRKLTTAERSLPSFRKSFIDVRVAIDVIGCAVCMLA